MKWIVDDRDGYKVICSECGREAPLDRESVSPRGDNGQKRNPPRASSTSGESGEYIKMRRCPYCKGNTDRPEQGRLGEGLR